MARFCPQCGAQLELRPFGSASRPTCPRCGFVLFADPKVAVSVLIARDGRLLLVRRAIEPARGLWCFPGGYVDYGEDPVHAAARECSEETGLEIHAIDLLDVVFNGTAIVIAYTASVATDAEPLPSDDADDAGWFDTQELPPLAFRTMERMIEVWSRKNQEPRTENQEPRTKQTGSETTLARN